MTRICTILGIVLCWAILLLGTYAYSQDRLRVNTDNVQIDGEVETEYDPEARQIANLNELDYGGNRTTEAQGVEFSAIEPVEVDFSVPPMPKVEYDTETGVLLIEGEDGEMHEVSIPKNEGKSVFPMVIVDAEGNKYQVDLPEEEEGTNRVGEDVSGEVGGKVTPTVTPMDDVEGDFSTENLDGDAGVEVRFTRGGGQYAFDSAEEGWYRNSALLREYGYYEPFGTNYIAPWKLVPVGETDTVEATIERGGAEAEDIEFVLKDGTGVPARYDGDVWTLSLPSVSSGETYSVFALYKKGRKLHTVGKLNVVSYPRQTHTVTLVPVSEPFTKADAGPVERELNKIYSPYGITINVNVDDKAFDESNRWAWDIDGDQKLNIEGSGFFSNETDEMKALRRLYQSTEGYDRNAYYIFLLTEAKADGEESAAAAGDMPRGRQFGYLFGGVTPWLAAHELGHGIFTLTHTFDNNYGGGATKGKTFNLMDYTHESELAAFQWSVMANPAPLTWFDTDEDAMSSVIRIDKLIKWIRENNNTTVARYTS